MDQQRALEVLTLAREVEAHAADPDASDWQERLDASDVGDAAAALLEGGLEEEALDLVGSLSLYWQDTGTIRDGIELCRSVLAGAGQSRSRGSARAHLAAGELAFRIGEQDAAKVHSETARDLADEVDDAWVAGRAEMNLARVAFRAGDAERIRRHATALLERAGDNGRLRAGGQHMLGWAHYTAGDVEAALDTFEANAELYHALNNPVSEASERGNIAELAMEAGDVARAAANLAAAFATPGVIESRYLLPSFIRSVGALASLRGDHETAVCLFVGADELYRRYGLEPDPGDELTPPLRAASCDALGESAVAQMRDTATTITEDELVEAARSVTQQ